MGNNYPDKSDRLMKWENGLVFCDI